MHHQAGMTLAELVIALALASVVLTTALVLGMPLMARETLRSAVHDTSAFMQLAKIEAVSRNRPCRFQLDVGDGTLGVWDMNGTVSATDDVLLHRGRLPEPVRLARPDAGSAVTVSHLGLGSTYGVTFTASGIVAHGTGEIVYQGGDAFGRVAVHSAGGVQITYWDGARWRAGS